MAEKEYIERGALIENMKRVYCADCNSYNGVRCRACGTGDALDMIEDAPTADVAPRAEVEREIVLEIDQLICCHANGDIDDRHLYLLFDEIKKKYTGV